MLAEALNVRLAGRGGQGIMLAGFLLAKAAADEGLHVVQTQSYGPEARLGAAKSDVILSPDEIAFPEILEPDVLLCLSRDAYLAYGPRCGEGTLRVIDGLLARELDVQDGVVLPFTGAARELRAPFAANIVALGAIVGLTGAVAPGTVREAIRTRVPADSFALNGRALDAGLRLAREVSAQSASGA
jgi:2-oxoglutarate ferredoxin oxidoreductase subunit gamma